MTIVDLAVRVSSVHELNTPYTATGLGDRVHLMTIAWAYANATNTSVTMHISSNGMTTRKRESFEEIVGLFPAGKINFQIHPYEGINEAEWLKFLLSKGINGIPFYYGDHLGRYEKRVGIDISTYLKDFPKISCKSESLATLALPLKYFATQWDSTAPSRTLSPIAIENILEKYRKNGCEPVVVGGLSPDAVMRESLSAAAVAISKAEFYAGVDSGFMHLAFLYLDFSRIHLYIDPKGYWAHHLFRAFDNGCIKNHYYVQPSLLQEFRIKLLYDSHIMNLLIFSHPRIVRILRSIGDISKFLRAQSQV